MTERDVLVALHVAAAVAFLGPLSISPWLFAATRSISALRVLDRLARIAASGSLVIPTLGLMNASRQERLGETWVILALVLAIIAAVVVYFGIVLVQHDIITARVARAPQPVPAGQPPTSPELPAETRLRRRLRWSAGAFTTTWILILLLMITKPT